MITKKRRCLWPVVRERQAIAAQLQSILRDLGLKRRHHELDIAAQLAAMHRPPPPSPPEPAPVTTTGDVSRAAGSGEESAPRCHESGWKRDSLIDGQ